MTKLYKVTVNNWGWNSSRTFLTDSKEAAENLAKRFPASDPVRYAGNFTDENAEKIKTPLYLVRDRAGWGFDGDYDLIVTQSDIEHFAYEWGKTYDELLAEVEAI